MSKKSVRKQFRELVFGRDSYKCITCGKKAVDAHHIIDRNEMPNGGYVLENGISLCSECHILAEDFHNSSGIFWNEGFLPLDLYKLINSSYELALEKSNKLKV